MRHLPEADKASLFGALRSSGLHPYILSDDAPLIVNVHSAEVTFDGSNDDESYLYTLTVTITE